MAGLIFRGSDFILSSCGGTSKSCIHSVMEPVGLGLPHGGGRYRLGEIRFPSPGCSANICIEMFRSGDGALAFRGGVGSRIEP